MMKKLVLPALLLFSIAVIFAAPFMGMQEISPSALFGGNESHSRILWDLRIPRVLLAWISGATLALCGLIFQALFRNPLASPDMLGVSTGAAFGAVVYIRLGVVFSVLGVSGLSCAAFAGALLSTAAICTGRSEVEIAETTLAEVREAMGMVY